MIPIRKWIIMLVLVITLVATTDSVYAQSYTSSDSILLSSQVHDFFNNYFSSSESYLYFPYECNDRTCYYGINNSNEYVNITYVSSSGYGYNYRYTTGVDENFSVSGLNVFRKEVSPNYIILYGIVFIFMFVLIFMLNRSVIFLYDKKRLK